MLGEALSTFWWIGGNFIMPLLILWTGRRIWREVQRDRFNHEWEARLRDGDEGTAGV
jgi:hypothetical protein